MKRVRILLALLLLATTPGCVWYVSLVNGVGTVAIASAPCGPWCIHADSGSTFQLTSLDPRFQVDGMRVQFAVRPAQDAATSTISSVCTDGQRAEVVSISCIAS